MPAITKKQRELLNAARKATGRSPITDNTPSPKKKRKLSGSAKQAVEEKAARKKAAKAPSPASDVKTGQVKQVRQLGGSAKQAKLSAASKAINRMKTPEKIIKMEVRLPSTASWVKKPASKAKTGKSLVPAKGRALQVISQASKAAKSMPMPLPLKAAMWVGSAVLPFLIGEAGKNTGGSSKQHPLWKRQNELKGRGKGGDPTSGKAANAPPPKNKNAGLKRKVASTINPNLPFRLGERKAQVKSHGEKDWREGNQYKNLPKGKQWVDISDGGLEDKMGKWIASKTGSYAADSGVEGTSSWIKRRYKGAKGGKAIRTH